MDKIPTDLTSSKDNDYVALNNLLIIDKISNSTLFLL